MGDFARYEVPPTVTGPDAPVKGEAPASAPTKEALRPDYIPEKFWKDGKVDVENLSKSYAELEKQRSQPPSPGKAPKPSEASAKPDAKSEAKGEAPKPEGEVKPEGEAKPEAQSYIPGLTNEDGQRFSQEVTTDGKLSDASYEQLAKVGYPKQIVDLYIKGIMADRDAEMAVGKEIKTLAGGEEAYTTMTSWMSANLPPEEVAEYNEVMSSGNKAVIRLAVKEMHSRYQDEVGAAPNLLSGQGNTPPKGDVFTSRAQVTVAMRDPRYKRDEGYRQEVQAKLGRSNI